MSYFFGNFFIIDIFWQLPLYSNTKLGTDSINTSFLLHATNSFDVISFVACNFFLALDTLEANLFSKISSLSALLILIFFLLFIFVFLIFFLKHKFFFDILHLKIFWQRFSLIYFSFFLSWIYFHQENNNLHHVLVRNELIHQIHNHCQVFSIMINFIRYIFYIFCTKSIVQFQYITFLSFEFFVNDCVCFFCITLLLLPQPFVLVYLLILFQLIVLILSFYYHYQYKKLQLFVSFLKYYHPDLCSHMFPISFIFNYTNNVFTINIQVFDTTMI